MRIVIHSSNPFELSMAFSKFEEKFLVTLTFTKIKTKGSAEYHPSNQKLTAWQAEMRQHLLQLF